MRTFWNDGLIDLVCGLGALAVGGFWLIGLIPLGGAVPLLAIPLWAALRRRISKPRLGYVEFSDERQHRQGTLLRSVVALGILAFVIVAGGVVLQLSPGPTFSWSGRSMVAALPSGILGLMSIFAFVLTHVPWFVLYAVIMALAGLGAVGLDADPGWAIIAGGAAVASIGAIRLFGFLRRHPLRAEDGERA